MPRDDVAQSAFLDVATNLLAVILLLTLFSGIGTGRHKYGSETAPVQSASSLRFLSHQREWFPPFSRFFFVTAGRMIPWDQAAVVQALQAAPAASSGHTWQGRYEWQAVTLRDLDGYRLRFYPDLAYLTAHTPLWTSAQTEHLLSALSAAARQQVAAVFIVYPDGMALFTPIYEQLRARGLRFRWFPQLPDAPFDIGREVSQFTHHVGYW